MLFDKRVIARTFISEGGKVKDCRKNYAVKSFTMCIILSLLVTSLMNRERNVACVTDIIQTIENSQKSCSLTACETERQFEGNLNVGLHGIADEVGSASESSDF
jgi:hypothetical protein